MSEIRNLIQKCIDQADEIEKLKQNRDSWGRVAETLQLEKLELREQLADANKKLATNKENDRVAEYHRQWEKELKLEGEG